MLKHVQETINLLNQGFALRKNTVFVSSDKRSLSLLQLLYKDGYILHYQFEGYVIKVQLNISSNFHFYIRSFFSQNAKYTLNFKELIKFKKRWNFLGDLYVSTIIGTKNVADILPYKMGGDVVFAVFAR